MRRKVLQDIANTLCQMMVGWRMGDDYERMSELPDGTIYFDLLEKTATHNAGDSPTLWIAGELSAWLEHRLGVEKIDRSELVHAQLELRYETSRIRTNRKQVVSFDFECRSSLRTDVVEYRGSVVDRHAYHQRIASSPSSKPAIGGAA
ncbi:hypothetical protein HEP74_04064 [Xanthomonas sp. SS]|uniref:hypothetical protein n=1 Tax=Xanthomonas sp. SS TaxID=2724122 RepID=UPI0016397B2F|nr:hypothetical protein [Xanthomonas sp. SS]QNH18888.1 hypothetical protein HEP74_04064 [Xanthomonas sp. SS]